MVRLKPLGQALSLLILIFAPLANADVLDEILDRGTIRVGVAEFAPWTIKTKSGELMGFEIDVARKIAYDMGVKPEFTVYEWEKIIPALQQGEIDVIAGGMAITPGRALKVNFSQPLATTGITLATNISKTQDITSLKELNDERVVVTVVADTLALSVAQTFFDQARINVHPTSDLAVKDVLEDRAHAYIATVPEVNFLALKNASKIDVPMTEPIMASSEGLAVKKGAPSLPPAAPGSSASTSAAWHSPITISAPLLPPLPVAATRLMSKAWCSTQSPTSASTRATAGCPPSGSSSISSA